MESQKTFIRPSLKKESSLSDKVLSTISNVTESISTPASSGRERGRASFSDDRNKSTESDHGFLSNLNLNPFSHSKSSRSRASSRSKSPPSSNSATPNRQARRSFSGEKGELSRSDSVYGALMNSVASLIPQPIKEQLQSNVPLTTALKRVATSVVSNTGDSDNDSRSSEHRLSFISSILDEYTVGSSDKYAYLHSKARSRAIERAKASAFHEAQRAHAHSDSHSHRYQRRSSRKEATKNDIRSDQAKGVDADVQNAADGKDKDDDSDREWDVCSFLSIESSVMSDLMNSEDESEGDVFFSDTENSSLLDTVETSNENSSLVSEAENDSVQTGNDGVNATLDTSSAPVGILTQDLGSGVVDIISPLSGPPLLTGISSHCVIETIPPPSTTKYHSAGSPALSITKKHRNRSLMGFVTPPDGKSKSKKSKRSNDSSSLSSLTSLLDSLAAHAHSIEASRRSLIHLQMKNKSMITQREKYRKKLRFLRTLMLRASSRSQAIAIENSVLREELRIAVAKLVLWKGEMSDISLSASAITTGIAMQYHTAMASSASGSVGTSVPVSGSVPSVSMMGTVLTNIENIASTLSSNISNFSSTLNSSHANADTANSDAIVPPSPGGFGPQPTNTSTGNISTGQDQFTNNSINVSSAVTSNALAATSPPGSMDNIAQSVPPVPSTGGGKRAFPPASEAIVLPSRAVIGRQLLAISSALNQLLSLRLTPQSALQVTGTDEKSDSPSGVLDEEVDGVFGWEELEQAAAQLLRELSFERRRAEVDAAADVDLSSHSLALADLSSRNARALMEEFLFSPDGRGGRGDGAKEPESTKVVPAQGESLVAGSTDDSHTDINNSYNEEDGFLMKVESTDSTYLPFPSNIDTPSHEQELAAEESIKQSFPWGQAIVDPSSVQQESGKVDQRSEAISAVTLNALKGTANDAKQDHIIREHAGSFEEPSLTKDDFARFTRDSNSISSELNTMGVSESAIDNKVENENEKKQTATKGEESVKPISLYKAPKRGIRVLSLDGGGIRGLLMLESIKRIEIDTGRPVWSLFDYIIGTSTGGMLALGLASRKSVEEIANQYYNIRDTFEGQTPWLSEVKRVVTGTSHSTSKAEHLLRSFFKDMRMTDLPRAPRVCAVTAAVDLFPAQPYLFRNYELSTKAKVRSYFLGTSHVSLFEAARATTSAPTFYEPAVVGKQHLVDGALVANNPSTVALAEVHTLWPQCNIDCFVSLGTGTVPLRPISTGNVVSFMKIAMECCLSADVPHRVVGTVLGNEKYFRFDPEGLGDIELSEVRVSTIEKMLQDGREFIKRRQPDYERLAAILMTDKDTENESSPISPETRFSPSVLSDSATEGSFDAVSPASIIF